jgi:hypothetical protein
MQLIAVISLCEGTNGVHQMCENVTAPSALFQFVFSIPEIYGSLTTVNLVITDFY